MAWYEEAFGEAYLDLYAHRDEREAHENIRQLLALINLPQDEPILDLCCGAGRYLCALRDEGYRRLYGLDLSEPLLRVARTKVQESEGDPRCQIDLLRGDMRHIPFENYFGAILSLFTSFGYFEEETENLRVLKGVYHALKPGGVFVLDHMNRPFILAHLVAEDEFVRGENRVHNRRYITPDGKRVVKVTTVRNARGEERTWCESVRLYASEEIVALCQEAGLANIAVYGSFQGAPLTETSPRMIVVAYKPKE